MGRVDNQRRLFLELIGELRPHWRTDPGLPRRVQSWLVRKRAGSRDRRLYRELAFTALRILPWIEAGGNDDALIALVARHAARSRATTAFIDAFHDQTDTPPEPRKWAELLPAWIETECPELLAPSTRDAMLSRAPLWIRIQTNDSASIAAEFTENQWEWAVSNHLTSAWRITGDPPLITSRSFAAGQFEIQDVGSQTLLTLLPDLPAGRWLDACAGAGGKTLQLAQLLPATTDIVAHDVRAAALAELASRAKRAGIPNITVVDKIDGEFDAVLVDAPCSGSGTWRRAPHLKWTTSPRTIVRSARRQMNLLDEFANHVKPGGMLVYATCSICRSENSAVSVAFLAGHPHFRPIDLTHPTTGEQSADGITLLPDQLDSDGYFVAAFRRS